MANILCVGDLHLADRPPSSCTETYLDDLFEILKHVDKLAKARKCSATVFAGDLFHLKAPSRTSHRLVQRIIDVFGSWSTPVYLTPGNHDLSNDRFESIFETQPLGVVLRSGSAFLLSGWNDSPAWMEQPLSWLSSDAPTLPIYGVPWLQEWTNANEGIRNQYVQASLNDLNSRFDGSVPVLLVTHAPFYPPGQELPYETFPTEKFAQFLPPRTSVYYGHVHDYHGEYSSGGAKFCNVGAITRGSLHECELTRKIAVALWDSDTGQFEEVVMPHKPASEVFRLQEVKEAKSVQMELNEFLRSVGSSTIKITSIESVIDHVKGMDLPADVVKVIEELFEKVGSSK